MELALVKVCGVADLMPQLESKKKLFNYTLSIKAILNGLFHFESGHNSCWRC